MVLLMSAGMTWLISVYSARNLHVLYGLCQYKEGVIIPNHAYKLKVVYKTNNYVLVMKTDMCSFTKLMVYTNWNKWENYQNNVFLLGII